MCIAIREKTKKGGGVSENFFGGFFPNFCPSVPFSPDPLNLHTSRAGRVPPLERKGRRRRRRWGMGLWNMINDLCFDVGGVGGALPSPFFSLTTKDKEPSSSSSSATSPKRAREERMSSPKSGRSRKTKIYANDRLGPCEHLSSSNIVRTPRQKRVQPCVCGLSKIARRKKTRETTSKNENGERRRLFFSLPFLFLARTNAGKLNVLRQRGFSLASFYLAHHALSQTAIYYF